jgi:hypothetical protein
MNYWCFALSGWRGGGVAGLRWHADACGGLVRDLAFEVRGAAAVLAARPFAAFCGLAAGLAGQVRRRTVCRMPGSPLMPEPGIPAFRARGR